MSTSFDPTHAVRFHLPQGSVRTQDDAPVVLLPMEALEELAKSASTATVARVGHVVGAAVGKRVAAGLGGGDGVRAATPEAVVSRLGGELALGGYGTIALERWGRAMVIRIEGAPQADALLAAILEEALGAASGRRVWCTPLMREAHIVRVLVSGEAGNRRVRDWLERGVGWNEVLARLQSNGGAT